MRTGVDERQVEREAIGGPEADVVVCLSTVQPPTVDALDDIQGTTVRAVIDHDARRQAGHAMPRSDVALLQKHGQIRRCVDDVCGGRTMVGEDQLRDVPL